MSTKPTRVKVWVGLRIILLLGKSIFEAAILPTINSMVGMGIVFLPGMMTGQILSGTDPTTGIAYQIAIMLGILGAVALTVFIMLHWGCRTFQ